MNIFQEHKEYLEFIWSFKDRWMKKKDYVCRWYSRQGPAREDRIRRILGLPREFNEIPIKFLFHNGGHHYHNIIKFFLPNFHDGITIVVKSNYIDMRIMLEKDLFFIRSSEKGSSFSRYIGIDDVFPTIDKGFDWDDDDLLLYKMML